jgi:hypothetical protein
MSRLAGLANFVDFKNFGNSFGNWQAKYIYLRKIFQRLFDRNYLASYICLFENREHIELIQFKNGEISKQRSFSVSDLEWKKYLKKHHDLPVYIIAQRVENTFKTLPAYKLKFWERMLMLRQIKNGESSNIDLVSYYRLQNKSYTIVSAQSSSALKNICKEFSGLPNVLAGVKIFELEVSKKMLALAALEHNLHNVTICVFEHAEKEFTLIVYDVDQLVLQRYVYCSVQEIETEVKATIKFLSRYGYKNEQSVSVVVPENILSDIKCLQNGIDFLPIAKDIFSRESYRAEKTFINFVPKILKEAYYGYVLPIVAIKYMLPTICVLALASLGLQANLFFNGSDSKILQAKYQDIAAKIPDDIKRQIYLYKQFQAYIAAVHKNPSWRISKINKNLLKAKSPANLISWQIKNDQQLDFEMLLKFNNLPSKKMLSLRKSFDIYGAKNLGEAEISWLEGGKEITLTIKGKCDNAA